MHRPHEHEESLEKRLLNIGLTISENQSLSEQIKALADSRTLYTRAMQETRAVLQQRFNEYKNKPADSTKPQSRVQSTLSTIKSDFDALDRAQETWSNPFNGDDQISPWLASRFKHIWDTIPVGNYAAHAHARHVQEIWLTAVEGLEERVKAQRETSITEALQNRGFQRKRADTGLQHFNFPTFMKDGVRIAMRRGGIATVENKVIAVDQPNSVSIEAIFTAKESTRISDMRTALEIVCKAADDLGISLHISPFPVDLGNKLKPLDGPPLKAFYEGIGFEVNGTSAMLRAPRHDIDLKKIIGLKPIPCSDQELEELANHYRKAIQGQFEEDGFKMHHLFDEPKEIVRTDAVANAYVAQNGYMTPEDAHQQIKRWKDRAHAQAKSGVNSDKVVLSLFDLSGEWSKPWREAGYDVYQFDIQAGDGVEFLGINTGDVTNFGTEFFNDIFASFDGKDVYAILAANPCTDLASSGARHFENKDAAGITAFSIDLVKQTLNTVEYFKPAIWAIENPTGRMERLGGLPQWSLAFDPNHFGEDYTKRTMLWGRMNASLPIAPCEPTKGSKMHSQYGGKSLATKNARSVTPEGFAYAFFMANNALDNPVLAMTNKYDRLDKTVIEEAVACGMSNQEIQSVVDDFYYFDLDDEGACEALHNEIERRQHNKSTHQASYTPSQAAQLYEGMQR